MEWQIGHGSAADAISIESFEIDDSGGGISELILTKHE